MARKGEGDDEDTEMGVVCTFSEAFEDGGCFEVGAVGMRGSDTLQACLDLRLEVVEDRGVDGFNCRNSWSSLALTLSLLPRRLVRKCGGATPSKLLAMYSSSRAQVFTLTPLMRISLVVRSTGVT